MRRGDTSIEGVGSGATGSGEGSSAAMGGASARNRQEKRARETGTSPAGPSRAEGKKPKFPDDCGGAIAGRMPDSASAVEIKMESLKDPATAALIQQKALFRPQFGAGPRVALCIGINNYPGSNRLPNCIADAQDMRDCCLHQFGFRSGGPHRGVGPELSSPLLPDVYVAKGEIVTQLEERVRRGHQ